MPEGTEKPAIERASPFSLTKSMYQRGIPVVIVSLFILIIIAAYFINYQPLTAVSDELTAWGNAAAAFAIIFSDFTILFIYGRRLMQRREKKLTYNAAVVYASFLFFIGLALSQPKLTAAPLYVLYYTVVLGQIGTGTGVLKGAYYAYATLRVFPRWRTPEIFILFLTFVVVVFRQLTLTAVLYPPIVTIGDWIMTIPYGAAERGALLAMGVASIVTALRAIAGKEPGLIEAEMA